MACPRRIVVRVMPAVGALLSLVLAAEGAEPASPAAVASALASGGHGVLFRPTESQDGPAFAGDPGQCGDQPRLTPQGWNDAKSIAKGLAALGLPFYRVYAALDCRSRHSAYLAFSADYTTHAPALSGTDAPALLGLVNRRPPAGGNAALFAGPGAASKIFPDEARTCGGLGPGDALVFRPNARGGPLFVGCLPFAFLRAWAAGPPQPVPMTGDLR